MDPVACMPVGIHVRQRVAALGLVFFIRVLQYLSVKSIALYRMDTPNRERVSEHGAS